MNCVILSHACFKVSDMFHIKYIVDVCSLKAWLWREKESVSLNDAFPFIPT